MKTKMVCAALLLTVGVSGVVVACGDMLPLPIPPVPVSIGIMDLTRATLAGYSANAGYAAAMKKLDTLGRAAVGSSAWRANSYGGYFAYSVTLTGASGEKSVGVNSIYVEKSCDQDFIDNADRTGTSGGGGGISQGGGCASSPSYGVVGWTETSIPWTVCSDGSNCSSGTYYEYELAYGQIAGDC